MFDEKRAVVARDAFLSEVVLVRLNAGDEILTALSAVCREAGIRNGVVLTGIGSLRESAYYVLRPDSGYPPTEMFHDRLTEPVEVLSLSGIIADFEPHLHVTLARRNQAFGGHVESGCVVHTLVELTIGRLAGVELKRLPDGDGGWNMLQVVGRSD